MKHLRCTALAIVTVALCAAPVAVAKKNANAGGGAVIAPAHQVVGQSGGELFAEVFGELLTNPAGTFDGSCIPLGGKGKVLSPQPDEDLTASCTVKPGTTLLVAFGAACSNVEDPPFFGETEAEQLACAIAFDEEFFVAASIAVDGGNPVDIFNRRFEFTSRQRSVVLPEDNILGVEPGPATFTAHGWGAIVRGLRPGEHIIEVTLTDVAGTATTTATINVVPGGRS